MLADTGREPLQAIGFWFSEFEPELPRPELLVSDEPPNRNLLQRLESGLVFEAYRGWSSCRFHCGAQPKTMGSQDFTDGRWVWPSGLAHYVRDHRVRLPDAFTSNVRQAEGPPPPRLTPVSRELWLVWSRAQGAAVDVSPPWHLVTRQQRVWPEVGNMASELRCELGAEHPLVTARAEILARRLDCDDVLVRVPYTSRLALVHLTWSGKQETGGFPRTTAFETWAEWNQWRETAE